MSVPHPQPSHSGSHSTTRLSCPEMPLCKPGGTTALIAGALPGLSCAWQDSRRNSVPEGPAGSVWLPDDPLIFQLTFMSPFLCPDTMSAPPQTPAHFLHQSALPGRDSHPHQLGPKEGHTVSS